MGISPLKASRERAAPRQRSRRRQQSARAEPGNIPVLATAWTTGEEQATQRQEWALDESEGKCGQEYRRAHVLDEGRVIHRGVAHLI